MVVHTLNPSTQKVEKQVNLLSFKESLVYKASSRYYLQFQAPTADNETDSPSAKGNCHIMLSSKEQRAKEKVLLPATLTQSIHIQFPKMKQ